MGHTWIEFQLNSELIKCIKFNKFDITRNKTYQFQY